MDAIQLWFRGEIIREFALEDRALEVGRAPYCDIVVHDSAVADRHFVLRAEGGTVMAYDLRADPRRPARRVLPRERPVKVGEHHAIVRVDRAASSEPGTDAIRRESADSVRYFVAVGRGADRRRAEVPRASLVVGTSPDSGLVVHDASVSARHVRFERTGRGVSVRDLGSRNGTYVDGIAVRDVELAHPVAIRVGRTDLHLERSDESDRAIVAASNSMRDVLAFVDRAARMPFPALLLGESGVGKEALARRIHDGSPRASGPYVAMNAAAVSRELVESQLFGHERGAFTGATSRHRGVFQQADGGTLFLDEIGELPLELQPRLLRVLETMEVRRVGAERAERVDVRIVCATHRDLPSMIERGEFRRDLYFRLAQLPVHVPPLRARPDDVAPIARAILHAEREGLGVRTLSAEAEAMLRVRDWPGNARELRNVLVTASALSPSPFLDGDAIRAALSRSGSHVVAPQDGDAFARALELHRGNVSAAARSLGVPRTTLRDWSRRVGREGASSADDE